MALSTIKQTNNLNLWYDIRGAPSPAAPTDWAVATAAPVPATDIIVAAVDPAVTPAAANPIPPRAAGIAIIGFAAAGVTAGSTAATIMSVAGTGAAVATAQSVGAAGLGAAGTLAAVYIQLPHWWPLVLQN
jgi:hypothetical protein